MKLIGENLGDFPYSIIDLFGRFGVPPPNYK